MCPSLIPIRIIPVTLSLPYSFIDSANRAALPPGTRAVTDALEPIIVPSKNVMIAPSEPSELSNLLSRSNQTLVGGKALVYEQRNRITVEW